MEGQATAAASQQQSTPWGYSTVGSAGKKQQGFYDNSKVKLDTGAGFAMFAAPRVEKTSLNVYNQKYNPKWTFREEDFRNADLVKAMQDQQYYASNAIKPFSSAKPVAYSPGQLAGMTLGKLQSYDPERGLVYDTDRLNKAKKNNTQQWNAYTQWVQKNQYQKQIDEAANFIRQYDAWKSAQQPQQQQQTPQLSQENQFLDSLRQQGGSVFGVSNPGSASGMRRSIWGQGAASNSGGSSLSRALYNLG